MLWTPGYPKTLMFLKEKRSGKLKGRACVNGVPQISYIRKYDASSPTVANESVFITSVIAAHEKRFVRCYDVPGAFLLTESDENVLMVLRGELAEIMVHIAPQIYRPYVKMNKKGTPILYVRLKKAIYVLLGPAYYSTENCVASLRRMVLRSNLMTHAWVTKW